MFDAIPVPLTLSVPLVGPIGPAILKDINARQKTENKLAKSEGREPRTITFQEVILANVAENLGVETTLPRRGRRWPAKVSE